MSLSDCEVCWDSLCTCDHKYETLSTAELSALIDVLSQLLAHQARRASDRAWWAPSTQTAVAVVHH